MLVRGKQNAYLVDIHAHLEIEAKIIEFKGLLN